MAKLETYELKVVGEHNIHCAGCENAVETSLSRLPGVKRVQADYNTQRVEISTDVDQTDLDALKDRLGELGYQTEPAS